MVVIAVVVDVVVAERLFDGTDSDGVWVAAATCVGVEVFNVGIDAVVGCCVEASSKILYNCAMKYYFNK